MKVSLESVIVLMAVLAIKHFCADFLFQTTAIARGKAARQNWLKPLLLHAFGHAAITFVIALVAFPRLWWIAPIEFAVHALIDRVKALAGKQAGLDPSKPGFWWLFGFDQLLHQLTNVVIAGVYLASIAS